MNPTMEDVPILLSQLINYRDSVLFVLASIILNCTFMALEKFFPKYLSYISLFTCHELSSWQHLLIKEEKIIDSTEAKTETTDTHDIGIKRDEVRSIMSNMGISLSQEGDQTMDYMRQEEFTALFDQMEPGLHEVKEAFSVFDQNGDGFIDAKELQTVLINLGLREGTDLDTCQYMIEQRDRNQDGKIDLSDFFELLESALL